MDKGRNMQTKIDLKNFTHGVFYEITHLSIYINMLAKNFFEIRNVDITHDEFLALNIIQCNPDICQRDLAKLMLRDRTRTGRILDSIEEKGYVERFNATKNNRLIRTMKITKRGKNIYETECNILDQIMNKLLEKIPENRLEDLRLSLKQLEQAISEIVELKI